MRILHVLSQVQITGAETYALTLARAQKSLGHEVFFVSDSLHEVHSFRFFPTPIHRENSSYWGRFKNVKTLRRIVRQEKIDLIHSHSRAANLVSYFSGVPVVTTVHGRWRNTFAFRQFPCLGRQTLAMCPYLERYLARDIGIPKSKITLIPNPVDIDRYSPGGRTNNAQSILYIGRFSGQKGKALRFMIEKVFGEVLRSFPDARIKILADTPTLKDQDAVKALNCGGRMDSVEIAGHSGELIPLYRKSSLIVGAGRVALEAMACGKPVIAIGESSAPGLLTAESFNDAFDSNFGDCGVWNKFLGQEARLVQDFKRILGDAAFSEKVSDWGRSVILERYDAALIAKRIEDVYKKALS